MNSIFFVLLVISVSVVMGINDHNNIKIADGKEVSISKKAITYEAEDAHATANIHVNGDHVTFKSQKFNNQKGHLIFTVFVKEDNVYKTLIRFKHVQQQQQQQDNNNNNNVDGVAGVHICKLSISANGHEIKTTILESLSSNEWSHQLEKLPLRQGLNTVVFKNNNDNDVSLDYIQIEGATLQATRGATLPYVEVEAESASNVSGVIVGYDRTPLTMASEASGRRAVLFNAAGHYVEFTLTAPANALVVRLSIPDTSDGVGQDGVLGVYVNGKLTLSLTVTSRFSWVYGDYPFNNTPSGGYARHFYDDARGLFGSTIPTGAKVRLAGLSPISYTIDLVDFYNVPAAYPQPSGYLSVSSYGADSTGSKDSTTAFNNAMSAAKSQRQGLYIPQGTYLISSHFGVNQITIRGAGPWYTVLKATTPGAVGFFGPNPPSAAAQGVGLYDFAIFGVTTYRVDSSVDQGLGGTFDSSCIIQNLWIEHVKVGMWSDGPYSGLHLTGLVVRNTWADGINLHIGVSNAIVEQSMIRNTGDDCIALWAENQADKNNIIRFNTVQLPILANTIAVYGGGDNSVTDNNVYDTVVEGAGIQVSHRFGAVALSGTTTIARNTITRCGGPNGEGSYRNGALWFWAQEKAMSGTISVSNIDIWDPANSAFTFWGLTTLTGVSFDTINIHNSPFVVSVWGTAGTTFLQNVVANNVTSGVCSCMSSFTVNQGSGNSGWSGSQCSSIC